MKRRLDELHPYSYTEYERQLIEAGRTSERPLAIVQAALNSVRLPPNVRRPDGTSAVREVPTVARNPVRWVGAYDRLAIGVALGGVAAAAVVLYAVQSRDVEKVPAPKPLVTEQERDRRVEQIVRSTPARFRAQYQYRSARGRQHRRARPRERRPSSIAAASTPRRGGRMCRVHGSGIDARKPASPQHPPHRQRKLTVLRPGAPS